jgi:hypothetical protein
MQGRCHDLNPLRCGSRARRNISWSGERSERTLDAPKRTTESFLGATRPEADGWQAPRLDRAPMQSLRATIIAETMRRVALILVLILAAIASVDPLYCSDGCTRPDIAATSQSGASTFTTSTAPS